MLILVGWKFWDSPPQFVVKNLVEEQHQQQEIATVFCSFSLNSRLIMFGFSSFNSDIKSNNRNSKLGAHYLVDMVCLLVSRKQKEKLSEGWFRVVTFQQLCKHSGIYDSRFREGNRNLSPTCDKNCQNSKIVFLKHRFKQFPKSY